MPTKKPDPPHDDPEQSRRFIEVAREVGADGASEADETFSRIIRKLGDTPKEPHRRKTQPPKKA